VDTNQLHCEDNVEVSDPEQQFKSWMKQLKSFESTVNGVAINTFHFKAEPKSSIQEDKM